MLISPRNDLELPTRIQLQVAQSKDQLDDYEFTELQQVFALFQHYVCVVYEVKIWKRLEPIAIFQHDVCLAQNM